MEKCLTTNINECVIQPKLILDLWGQIHISIWNKKNKPSDNNIMCHSYPNTIKPSILFLDMWQDTYEARYFTFEKKTTFCPTSQKWPNPSAVSIPFKFINFGAKFRCYKCCHDLAFSCLFSGNQSITSFVFCVLISIIYYSNRHLKQNWCIGKNHIQTHKWG